MAYFVYLCVKASKYFTPAPVLKITTDSPQWNLSNGGSSIQEYVSSRTQSQTSVSFGRTDHTIRSNGTYESKSQSRASNTTIRESESGTIILSGGFIIKRSSTGPEMKYQFVAFMVQPNGSAVLTLIFLGERPRLTLKVSGRNAATLMAILRALMEMNGCGSHDGIDKYHHNGRRPL